MNTKVAALAAGLVKVADGTRFNELLFAQKLIKKLPPILVIDGVWYMFDGSAWRVVSRNDFAAAALAICPKRHRKARNAKAILDHIEMACSARAGDDLIGFNKFDEHEDGSRSVLINVANGVLKVWPGGEITLEKSDKAHRFTEAALAKWDEKADCPVFRQVVAEALPDVKDQALLQVFAGNVLLPTSEHETALISTGQAGTSKSTIAEGISNTLAELSSPGNLVTALSMPQICASQSYSLPKLRHAALNLGTEVDTIDLDESTNFKQLVSGETVEARAIYGKPMPMRTTAKLWFLANTLPRFKTGTDAELRRLRFIHHNVVPAKKDVSLKARLRAERNGIFAWMVEGLVWLLQNKNIPQGGEGSQRIVKRFEISNDPVGYFSRTRCIFDPARMMKKSDLSDAYKAFLSDHGLNPALEHSFFSRFKDRHTTTVFERKHRESASAAYIRCLYGVTLNTEEDSSS